MRREIKKAFDRSKSTHVDIKLFVERESDFIQCHCSLFFRLSYVDVRFYIC